MSRYWNGHQWKNLPTENIPPQHGDIIAIAETDVTASQAVAEPAVNGAVTVTIKQQTAIPLRASLAPTHAEYGDVFIAAAEEAAR